MCLKGAKYFVSGLKHLALFQDARSVRFLTQSRTPAKGLRNGTAAPSGVQTATLPVHCTKLKVLLFEAFRPLCKQQASRSPACPILVWAKKSATISALDIRSRSANSVGCAVQSCNWSPSTAHGIICRLKGDWRKLSVSTIGHNVVNNTRVREKLDEGVLSL